MNNLEFLFSELSDEVKRWSASVEIFNERKLNSEYEKGRLASAIYALDLVKSLIVIEKRGE